MNLKILKLENIDKAPEIMIYFMIEGLGDFIHCIHRARTRPSGGEPGLFTEEMQADVDNAHADQKQLVEMLKQRDGFEFKDHDDYMRWYRWWHAWHTRELDNEQWRKLDRLLKWDGTQTEETFANWRPDGDWKETIDD